MHHTCLLVTHLSLAGLALKQYGIYRRLSILAQAAVETNAKLRIFCMVPHSERADGEDISAQISREIKTHWGIDAEVFVGSLNAPSKLPWLLQQCRGAICYLWSPLVRGLLDEPSKALLRQLLTSDIDFVFAHRLPMMTVMLQFNIKRKVIFFDLDDLEHVAAMRSIPETKSTRNKLFTLLGIPALILAERRAAAHAALTFVCSTTDATRAGHLLPTQKISVLPNAITIPAAPASLSKRPILLMVGIYSYGPNKDAADYFVSEIFPLIQQKNPDAEIWFVGGSPEHLRSYETNNNHIRFLGFVEDLGAIYNQTRIVICPIRQGSGTRVKLVEAAAWGKPIVTTTIGAEGLNMIDGIHALFGDTAITFAERCIKLLADDALCVHLTDNARALAEQTYDKREVVRKLANELSTYIN